MPAVTPPDILVLPRVPRVDTTVVSERPVVSVTSAIKSFEGEGFPVNRPFPGKIALSRTDPFLLLDQMGEVEYAPGEPKGTPWHPHRGFETVTYMIDGAFEHNDSIGGGGLIKDGATQWMTAGDGILHIEKPPEALVAAGGLFHGIQLWVNLPRELKRTPAQYQDITAASVKLLTSDDGGALIRLIAGSMAGYQGPGRTRTPITYAHVTISSGAELVLPWDPSFNAMVYVLAGQGEVGGGSEPAPIGDKQLALFGAGEAIRIKAAANQDGPTNALEILMLGGRPIREPIAHYGPFVMNTREEVIEAMEDFQKGRMGQIPVPHV